MNIVPIAFALHPEDESPITGDRTTHIRLCDEGGGTFIALFQWTDGEEQCIRLDLDEIEPLIAVMKELKESAND